jgi:hypothetical protein
MVRKRAPLFTDEDYRDMAIYDRTIDANEMQNTKSDPNSRHYVRRCKNERI